MSSSKTIARNTIFLYFRMIMVMGVSLYTSRIVLHQLGVSDFGIYSLVGGVVALFTILNSAMSLATQRYLTFNLGKGDEQKLQQTFSATLIIHFAIAIIVLIVGETVGLWYITKVMVFPPERSGAVMVIYQVSILSAMLGIMQVPYNALIIAREQMHIFAYISVLEVVLKLIAVLTLVWFPGDKLIAYAIMILVVATTIRVLYQLYCRRHFPESHFKYYYNREYYNELISYSGWSLFGNLASLARTQGINMVLNSFFGTLINAAYGITAQVTGAAQSFVNNFQVALNPQIIKSYSQNRIEEQHRLICQGVKLSYLLVLLIATPIFLETEYILKLWLKEVPLHTALFVRLSLIALLIDSIAGPIIIAIQATGKIKRYQMLVGTLVTLSVPISYIALKQSPKPEIVFIVLIGISLIAMQLRLISLQRVSSFKVAQFYKTVVARLALTTFLVVTFWLLIRPAPAQNLLTFLLHSAVCVIGVAGIGYIVATNRAEKEAIHNLLKRV